MLIAFLVVIMLIGMIVFITGVARSRDSMQLVGLGLLVSGAGFGTAVQLMEFIAEGGAWC